MNEIKSLALVGFGGMGNQHLKKLESVSCIKVVGIYDIDQAKMEKAKAEGYHTFDSLNEVLNDKSIDVVLIATPNGSHKSIAISALKSGKNVICEKPATIGSADLQEIINAEKESGNHFMVHQNRRWDKNYLMIKKLYDEKTLGEVFYLESRVQGSRGVPAGWRKDKQEGGGMVFDWGVHLVDRILLLFSDVKITSIYSELSYILGHEVDDGFKIHLKFSDGKRALIDVGTSNFIKLPEWYVTGTIGTAVIEDYELNGKYIILNGNLVKEAIPIETGAGLTKTMAPRNDDSITEYPLPPVESNVCEFYYNIVDVIDGKASPVVKNTEVMRVMRVLEAAFESAEKNEVIHFEGVGL